MWPPRQCPPSRYVPIVTLHGSHEVLYTNPALLAAKLELAGRD